MVRGPAQVQGPRLRVRPDTAAITQGGKTRLMAALPDILKKTCLRSPRLGTPVKVVTCLDEKFVPFQPLHEPTFPCQFHRIASQSEHHESVTPIVDDRLRYRWLRPLSLTVELDVPGRFTG